MPFFIRIFNNTVRVIYVMKAILIASLFSANIVQPYFNDPKQNLDRD